MESEMRRVIGRRLRQARLSAGLTQVDVATDFLRSRQAISSWESGKTLPSLLEFRELAVLYGVPTDLILLGSDDVEGVCRRALAKAKGAVQAPSLPAPSRASP